MKRLCLITALAAMMAVPARAQVFGPESVAGALLGTFIGGVAGAGHHHGFSGTGAAIGAGAGFVAGTLIGQANRRAYTDSYGYCVSSPVAYVQPGYGYVYAPAPVYVVPAPQSAPVVVAPAPAPPPAKRICSLQSTAPIAPQIPDAPRVPDAPTF